MPLGAGFLYVKKENIKTIIISDGDVLGNHSLQREVIELYADLDYINQEQFKSIYEELTSCKKLLNGFINYFKNKS